MSPMSTVAHDTEQTGTPEDREILSIAREQVLERGVPLDEAQILRVMQTSDAALSDLLALAHEVRMT
ncbi:MAG: biotin synthase BioB, partial [Marmoricola sp.]|nr:biotin synthase BioB [Marmoricola sp.]